MSFPYPEKPWTEGQTHEVAMGDGTYLLGQYNEAKNLWSFRRLRDDQVNRERVFTFDVYTSVSQPAPREKSPFDISDPLNMQTQQDVNWFLWQEILKLTAGNTAIWIDNIEPPKNDEGEFVFKFWWHTDENQLYYWSDENREWILTGAMDFDRPPIVAATAPTEHPKFPGEDLQEGDFWYSTNLLELYVWYNDAWFPSALPASGVSEEVFTYSINRINSIIEEVYLKNISQDDRLDVLEENIVELEEEIDAIAPSVERGEWNFNPLVASPTNYTMLKGDGSPTDIFSQARLIFVSTTDADGNPHGFNNHEPGELLQIFNKDDDEYGLYEITDIDDNSSNSQNPYFSFTVDFVRAFSSVGKAINRSRFKFFNAPEGGTADGFVLKTGDKMSGTLRLQYIQGYKASNDTDYDARIDLGNYSFGATMEWQPNKPRISWNENGGVLWGGYGNSTASIINWSRVLVDDNSSYDYATYNGVITEPKHITNKEYVDKLDKGISAAGLQLGEFAYRRNGDSQITGGIKSNGTTNPKVLTQFDMHKQSKVGVFFGQDFYLKYIVPDMFMRIRDGNDLNHTYVGKITAIEGINNGVRMTLSPVDSLCGGTFYVDSRYDVSFSYSKYF